eukprot:1238318-Alexandrium_andersonii.AAC.1
MKAQELTAQQCKQRTEQQWSMLLHTYKTQALRLSLATLKNDLQTMVNEARAKTEKPDHEIKLLAAFDSDAAFSM